MELKHRIGNWIYQRIDFLELILVLIFAVAFALKTQFDIPVNPLIVISLSALSLVYFLSSFKIPEVDNPEAILMFANTLSGYSLSVVSIGILFNLMNFSGSNIMLIVGSLNLILILPTIIYMKSKNKAWDFFNNRYLIRLFIIAVSGIYLWFF